jgi:hypothetical protein
VSVTLAGITLPEDIEWPDEFGWSPVTQQREVTTGGSLLVEESEQAAGRPITLRSGQGDPRFGVVTRTTVLALRALADEARGQDDAMELDIDGQTFDVLFRHTDGALEAAPLLWRPPPDGDDLYAITLRLITV